MGKSLLTSGHGASFSGVVFGWFGIGQGRANILAVVEADASYPFWFNSVMDKMQFTTVGSTTLATIITFRKNGLDGNMVITLPPTSGSGLYEDLINSDSVDSGDTLNYEFDKQGGGILVPQTFVVQCKFSGATQTQYLCAPGNLGAGVTSYLGGSYVSDWTTSELDVLTPTKENSQCSNLFHDVFEGPTNTCTITMVFRVNSIDGNQTLTTIDNIPGYYVDNINTDDLFVDDVANMRGSKSAGTNDLSHRSSGYQEKTFLSRHPCTYNQRAGGIGNSTDDSTLGGWGVRVGFGGDAGSYIRGIAEVDKLQLRVTSNTGTANVTCDFFNNLVAQNQSLAFPAGVSGLATDEINVDLVFNGDRCYRETDGDTGTVANYSIVKNRVKLNPPSLGGNQAHIIG